MNIQTYTRMDKQTDNRNANCVSYASRSCLIQGQWLCTCECGSLCSGCGEVSLDVIITGHQDTVTGTQERDTSVPATSVGRKVWGRPKECKSLFLSPVIATLQPKHQCFIQCLFTVAPSAEIRAGILSMAKKIRESAKREISLKLWTPKQRLVQRVHLELS